MLHATNLELLLDYLLDLGGVAAPELEQATEQHKRVALEPRVPVGELEPRRRPSLDALAVERGDGAFDRDLADVLPVAAGIPVERAAYRPGNAGCELESSETPITALIDEVEEVGAAADVGGGAVEFDPFMRVADHQAAESAVGDQQITAAAEQENGNPSLVAGPQRGDQLVRGVRGEIEVGRTADPERGVVAKRLLGEQPVAERLAEPILDRGGAVDHRACPPGAAHYIENGFGAHLSGRKSP